MKQLIHLITGYHRRRVCIGAMILTCCILGIYNTFLSSGSILFSDLDFGIHADTYIDRIYPLWNEQRSTPNFFNATRAYIIYPLQLIANLTHTSDNLAQRVILTIAVISARGMYVLTIHLWKLRSLSSIAPLPSGRGQCSYLTNKFSMIIVAIIVAVLYAYNPWFIIRIQHIFLLVGYACIPRLIRLGIHLMKTAHSSASTAYYVIATAFVYAYASGAVHYVVFIAAIFAIRWVYRSATLVYHKRYRTRRHITSKRIRVAIIYLGLTAYRLLPYVQSLLITDITPSNINTLDSLGLFSRFSSIIGVLTLSSYRRPMMDTVSVLSDTAIFRFFFGSILIISIVLVIRYIHSKLLIGTLIGIIVLSIGGYYDQGRPVFRRLVFDNPLASVVGFLFRDPNKIAGFLPFIYAILLSGGLGTIMSKCADYYRTHMMVIQTHTKRHHYQLHRSRRLPAQMIIVSIVVVIITSISIRQINKPFHNIFIDNYYRPLATPGPWLGAQTIMHTGVQTLILPDYQELPRSPGYDVTVAQRDTSTHKRGLGSVYVFGLPVSIFHPHEGSSPSIEYRYNYINHALAHNQSPALASLMRTVGYQQVIYHDDILGYTNTTTQLAALDNTLGTGRHQSYNFIHTWQTPASDTAPIIPTGSGLLTYHNSAHTTDSSVSSDDDWLHIYRQRLFHLGGRYSRHLASTQRGTGTEQRAQIFPYQQYTKTRSVGTGDIILTDSAIDRTIAQLDPSLLAFPFDENNFSDPFSQRAKDTVMSRDRRWHMDRLGIRNAFDQWDMGRGIIYSYTPRQINLLPNTLYAKKGNNILTIDNYDQFYRYFQPSVAHNRSNIQLSFDARNNNTEKRYLQGQVTAGGSQLRQVAQSINIPVSELTPYYISMDLAGDGVRNMHGKVIMYDTNNHEVGVAYIGVPENLTEFSTQGFGNFFVTTQGVTHISIQINTMQNPGRNSYRRLHSLRINDLSDYSSPTKSTIHHTIPAGSYTVWMRNFVSPQGGIVDFSINNTSGSISTRSTDGSYRKRLPLTTIWTATPQTVVSDLYNTQGFNAINALAFVPHTGLATAPPTHQAILIHPLLQGNRSGNIISSTTDDTYTLGMTLQALSGIYTKSFDIITTGNYTITINTNPSLEKGIIRASLVSITSTGQTGEASVLSLGQNTQHIHTLRSGITLTPGQYTLSLDAQDQSPSMVDIMDLRPGFDEYRDTIIFVREDTAVRDQRLKQENELSQQDQKYGAGSGGYIIQYLQEEPGCSHFYQIPQTDTQYTYSGTHELTVTIKPGFGCGFLSTTHRSIPVIDNEEYIISYDVSKKNSKALHAKMNFFDASGHVMNLTSTLIDNLPVISTYLADYEYAVNDNERVHTQHIIRVPAGAQRMRRELLSRQRQDTPTTITISNLTIKPYRRLIGRDMISIIPTQQQILTPSRSGAIHDQELITVSSHRSYSPRRRVHDSTGHHINGFMQGYTAPASQLLDQREQFVIQDTQNRGYRITMITLSIIGIMILIITIQGYRKRLVP